MDVLTIVGIIGVIVGIVAGVVQIMDYLQKRRHESDIESPSNSSSGEHETKTLSEQEQLTALRQLLIQHFNDGELQTLCFDLGVDYENLPGQAKADKARELVEYVQRRNRLAYLVQMCQQLRPNATWPERMQEMSGLPPALQMAIPHNLPRRATFVGREREKDRIHKALLLSDAYAVSIDGIGGIGKSALALEVAHDCLEAARGNITTDSTAQFKGFIWATAKDKQLSLDSLLDKIARALEYPGIAQQSLPDKKQSVKKLLRTAPHLLIVDNFETITDKDAIDFVRALPSPSKVLITTRQQNLHWTNAISLKGLSQAEGLTLIRLEGERIGIQAFEDVEDATLIRLYEATGGAPLAIRWTVGQIKHRGQSLESILEVLHGARGDMFEDLFSRSWSLMTVEARQVLLVMPIFVVPAERDAVQAASGLESMVLDQALGLAVELWLIEATDELLASRRRYTIHPLTRSFAQTHLSSEQRLVPEARLNLARYYLEKGCKMQGDWGEVSGFPWFEAELQNIFSIIGWLNQNQKWEELISIFRCCYFFLGTAGYWEERVRFGRIALEAAKTINDHDTIAEMLYALGWTLFRQGHFVEAEEVLEASKEEYMDLQQRSDASWAMIALAKMMVMQGNLERARVIVEEATELAGAEDYQRNSAGLLTARGKIELQSGNIELAQTLFREALDLTKQRDNKLSVGSRQIDLGEVALAQNNLNESERLFREGLANSEQFLRQDNMALANFGLAKVYSRRGKETEAKKQALIARDQFERLGIAHAISEVDKLIYQLTDNNEQ